MRSKTTITIETIKQVRIIHPSPEIARSCPFCDAEMVSDGERSGEGSCKIPHEDAAEEIDMSLEKTIPMWSIKDE